MGWFSKCGKALFVAFAFATLLALASCAQSQDAASEESGEASGSSAVASIASEESSDSASEAEKEAEEKASKEREEAEAKEKAAAEAKESLEAVKLMAKTEVLEYSDKKTDPVKLIECDDDEVTIAAVGDIDLGKLGKQDVIFTLSKDGQSVKRTVSFEVRDTKRPVIKLGEESSTIEVNDDYDVAGNITSVSDPVDGEMVAVDVAPEPREGVEPGTGDLYDAGWFIVEGKLDSSKPGKYSFTVHAEDRHGNEASKAFTVIVVEPQTEAAATPGEAEEKEVTYVLNVKSKKFHYPTCSSVDQMKPENRSDSYETREEIIAKGYKPCQNCNP
ncbi:MAG: hypothetical protein IJI68_13890 [Eggerthellaceae bacterium]|nr:hypothetical protein [Eggerthellaceae bacterium]